MKEKINNDLLLLYIDTIFFLSFFLTIRDIKLSFAIITSNFLLFAFFYAEIEGKKQHVWLLMLCGMLCTKSTNKPKIGGEKKEKKK